jgi:hypothetical protein
MTPWPATPSPPPVALKLTCCCSKKFHQVFRQIDELRLVDWRRSIVEPVRSRRHDPVVPSPSPETWLRAFEINGFDLGSADPQPGLAGLIGFAPNWARLGKIEISMTGNMSPRAKPTLAAMRMAFRVANIARSFDIGHLAFFPGCVAANITPLNRRD